MGKWIGRLLLAGVILLVLLVGGALVAYHKLHGRPQWYRTARPDSGQREQAASLAEDKLVETRNELMASRAKSTSAAQLPQALKISFTEDELNAFYVKWDQQFGWSEKYHHYLADPQLRLSDGHCFLAATAPAMDSVVSLDIEPRVDADGQLRLQIAGVSAGDLPVPTSVWRRYADQALVPLESNRRQLLGEAGLRADGTANTPLVQVTLLELLRRVLLDQPASSTLFLPTPVKITSIDVRDASITIWFEPLNHEDAQRALDDLKAEPSEPPAASR